MGGNVYHRVSVPCGSCHLCCKLMTPLRPEFGDKIEEYDWARWYDGDGTFRSFILMRKPNGDCVYLTDAGCSIHDRAPSICREFDCRSAWSNSDRNGRRAAIKEGRLTREIFLRGRELIEAERVR